MKEISYDCNTLSNIYLAVAPIAVVNITDVMYKTAWSCTKLHGHVQNCIGALKRPFPPVYILCILMLCLFCIILCPVVSNPIIHFRSLHPLLSQMILKGISGLTKKATKCYIRVFASSSSMIERLFTVRDLKCDPLTQRNYILIYMYMGMLAGWCTCQMLVQ